MPLDFSSLTLLRQQHPAWRLLCSDHAPLIASFLEQTFITRNQRSISATDLAESLEDMLFGLRQTHGAAAFPKAASEYLNDWAASDKAWLRKFYAQNSDQAYFDLTPSTEKAIAWLQGLQARNFVGTESRLLTLFDLLKQMSEGSEADPQQRLRELKKQRAQLERQIARAQRGEVDVLDDTAIKDRFQQFISLARELLADFREVETNFRQLDRRVRERIALWDGPKGQLLAEIMGERDAIADSDQGKSFRAFWDFLMSPSRQEDLSRMLEQVLALPAVAQMQPDTRTKSIHYDWLEAADHTQNTVALLSQQLRRFLDDQAWLENRRIMEILHEIEGGALAIRGAAPQGAMMEIEFGEAEVELAMERPLYSPSIKPVLASLALQLGDDALDASALYSQVVIDKTRLAQHIRLALQQRSQISLLEICQQHPLQHGLAELIAYLQLSNGQFNAWISEEENEVIHWQGQHSDGTPYSRSARMPRVIFLKARK